jgi:EAL domain-containing protein (putative c-di-GMP-specific phosphodiesterase class I)
VEIAKQAGHTEIQVYHPSDKRLTERDSVMAWVARINAALDNNRLRLRCQKIAPVGEGDHKPHYEVLLTILDEDGEHQPPVQFIKAAEEYSRMAQVDRWVIDKILNWMQQHKDFVDSIGGFAINLSGHSMNDDTFMDFMFDRLVQTGVPRKKLIFEVTETTAVTNLEDAADFIAEMKEIGCRFSLDDFGAGQSSYSYLKHCQR